MNVLIIAVTAAGAGYTDTPEIAIGAPDETDGVQATATAVLLSGAVSAIKITEKGSGYTAAPEVTIDDPPSGVGASTATATAYIGKAYASATDLTTSIPEVRLAELTADSGTLSDPLVLVQVLEEASTEIDTRLRGRYTTPITGNAQDLETLEMFTKRIAKWILFGRRLITSTYEEIKFDYKTTLDELDLLRKGEGSLGSPPRTPVVETDEVSLDGSAGSQPAIFGVNVGL